VQYGLSLPNARFALLSDYVNSRGASDLGLLPDFLPGYVPVDAKHGYSAEYGERFPSDRGLDLLEMFDAAGRGDLAALYIVGSNPVARYSVDPSTLQNTFVVVHEMFMTETARLADVILPAANLYEKSGSVTNSFGDLQLVKKAGDKAGVRSDLELIVRVADKMGAEVKKLVPFGKNGGLRADLGLCDHRMVVRATLSPRTPPMALALALALATPPQGSGSAPAEPRQTLPLAVALERAPASGPRVAVRCAERAAALCAVQKGLVALGETRPFELERSPDGREHRAQRAFGDRLGPSGSISHPDDQIGLGHETRMLADVCYPRKTMARLWGQVAGP